MHQERESSLIAPTPRHLFGEPRGAHLPLRAHKASPRSTLPPLGALLPTHQISPSVSSKTKRKHKQGFPELLHADSQPSSQAGPLSGRAKSRLLSPKVVTDQFSKLHENRKQTENQIHQSLSLENSLAGRSNVLTISCCFKSF